MRQLRTAGEHPSCTGNDADGEDVIEFSLPNAADEKSWHWHRGGRDIGACIFVTATDGKIYSIYEPYVLFYARMLEP